jgi:hypothetical protein
MWTCSGCNYHNEDWDETCQRCGIERISSQALEPAATGAPPHADATLVAPLAAQLHQQVANAAQPAPEYPATTTPPPQIVALELPAATPPRPRKTEALLIVLILVILASLAGVVYLAWWRELLDPYLPEQMRRVLPYAPPATGADAASGTPQAALSEQDILEDPLDRIDQGSAPGLNTLKPFAKSLRTARQTLMETTFHDAELGTLTPESQQLLASTAALGEGLLKDYQSFEDKAARITNEKTAEYKQLLRDEFLKRFIELFDVIGQAYALDKTGQNQAYVLSDNVPRVLEQYKQIDPAPLRERWQQVLHAREQLFLDMKNQEEYRQLRARYEALLEVHNSFKDAMKAVPPYHIRAGMLDQNAEQALTLYDALATKIEDLALEFEQYRGGLDANTESDKRKELLKNFTDLAQTDHYTCFLETYKIYAMDQDLTHDAYTRLVEVHYPFAKEHWPEKVTSYDNASYQYEEEWKLRWHKE